MARTKEFSLNYFPMDVSFFSDLKVRRLRAKFGVEGTTFLLYVYCRCYGGKGYFISADDDFFEDVEFDLGYSQEKSREILDYLLEKSLLDRKNYEAFGILTSHGVQAQYQKCKKTGKRTVEVEEKFWILDEDETEDFITFRKNPENFRKNPDNSEKIPEKSWKNLDNSEKNLENSWKNQDNSEIVPENSENYAQSKGKESKVNKSKEKEKENKKENKIGKETENESLKREENRKEKENLPAENAAEKNSPVLITYFPPNPKAMTCHIGREAYPP